MTQYVYVDSTIYVRYILHVYAYAYIWVYMYVYSKFYTDAPLFSTFLKYSGVLCVTISQIIRMIWTHDVL